VLTTNEVSPQTQASRRSRTMLDVFYLAIGAAGFLVLWGIVIACNRV
jgi:hypothetical protein